MKIKEIGSKGWEERRIPGGMIKRFGGKSRPLPNAGRDRELVNLPHPKILASKNWCLFSSYPEFVLQIILKLSVSEKCSFLLSKCTQEAIIFITGHLRLSKQVKMWEMLWKQTDPDADSFICKSHFGNAIISPTKICWLNVIYFFVATSLQHVTVQLKIHRMIRIRSSDQNPCLSTFHKQTELSPCVRWPNEDDRGG